MTRCRVLLTIAGGRIDCDPRDSQSRTAASRSPRSVRAFPRSVVASSVWSNTRLTTAATTRDLLVGRLLILAGRSSRLLERLVKFLVQKLSLLFLVENLAHQLFLMGKLVLQLLVEKLVYQLLVELVLDTIAARKCRLGVWVQVAHQAVQVRDRPCLGPNTRR
jgi:hypothetical protein